jgi:hypothetical protein
MSTIVPDGLHTSVDEIVPDGTHLLLLWLNLQASSCYGPFKGTSNKPPCCLFPYLQGVAVVLPGIGKNDVNLRLKQQHSVHSHSHEFLACLHSSGKAHGVCHESGPLMGGYDKFP